MSLFTIPDEMMPQADVFQSMWKDAASLMSGETFQDDAKAMAGAPVALAGAMALAPLAMMAHGAGLLAGMTRTAGFMASTLPGLSDTDTRATAFEFTVPGLISANAALVAETLEEHAAEEFDDGSAIDETSAESSDEAAATAEIVAFPAGDSPAPAAPHGAVTAPGMSAAEIEPEDFVQPMSVERPDAPDDLKMIAGVGPKIEGILNELGIWTFAQVAAWTPAEVAWVDDYLRFKGRIERDSWIAQASALAKGGRDEYVKVFGKEPR